MASLDVQDLWVSYGSAAPVLRGVSLTVGSGEMVALIGPNGAGKSTLLRTISGLLKPRRGRIELDGESIAGLPAQQVVRRGVGHVPEGRLLFPEMTVAENLRMGRYALRAGAEDRAREERVHELFPILREREHQRAGRMSGGEQQMVAIARGLMSEPRLLLLDEPSIGLAPRIVQSIGEAIEAINREFGIGVVLVEQNAELALSLSSRAYVLELGEIRHASASSELAADRELRREYLAI